MSLFLASFLSVYAAMHAALWFGLRPVLPTGRAGAAGLLGWAALMIAAPLLSRLCEKAGFDFAARTFAWAGYLWLGFVFIACSLLLLRGILNLVLRLGRFLAPQGIPAPLTGGPAAVMVILLTLGFGLYALYEASEIRIETVPLTANDLPRELDGLRIAQISDLHLGLIHRQKTLEQVKALIESTRPDLIVATGDIVDAHIDRIEPLIATAASLYAPLGKFAVTGNHEGYVGLDGSLDFLRQSGFTVLRGESRILRPGLIIAGIDDPAVSRSRSESDVLPPFDSGSFVIFLKHRPLIEAGSPGRFDLQLSGHSHRGQIFPFTLLTGWRFPMQNGLYKLERGAHLYTSRGTGTWGPPMRLFAPPEITLFVLHREPMP